MQPVAKLINFINFQFLGHFGIQGGLCFDRITLQVDTDTKLLNLNQNHI